MTEKKQTVRPCPDCPGSMVWIRLIESPANGGHTSLSYAAAEAEKHWFTNQYSSAGEVVACMCTSCGRIVLYGAPYEK